MCSLSYCSSQECKKHNISGGAFYQQYYNNKVHSALPTNQNTTSAEDQLTSFNPQNVALSFSTLFIHTAITALKLLPPFLLAPTNFHTVYGPSKTAIIYRLSHHHELAGHHYYLLKPFLSVCAISNSRHIFVVLPHRVFVQALALFAAVFRLSLAVAWLTGPGTGLPGRSIPRHGPKFSSHKASVNRENMVQIRMHLKVVKEM